MFVADVAVLVLGIDGAFGDLFKGHRKSIKEFNSAISDGLEVGRI